jgi:hypothetical protein
MPSRDQCVAKLFFKKTEFIMYFLFFKLTPYTTALNDDLVSDCYSTKFFIFLEEPAMNKLTRYGHRALLYYWFFKGTLTRDFRPLDFFIKQLPLGP